MPLFPHNRAQIPHTHKQSAILRPPRQKKTKTARRGRYESSPPRGRHLSRTTSSSSPSSAQNGKKNGTCVLSNPALKKKHTVIKRDEKVHQNSHPKIPATRHTSSTSRLRAVPRQTQKHRAYQAGLAAGHPLPPGLLVARRAPCSQSSEPAKMQGPTKFPYSSDTVPDPPLPLAHPNSRDNSQTQPFHTQRAAFHSFVRLVCLSRLKT